MRGLAAEDWMKAIKAVISGHLLPCCYHRCRVVGAWTEHVSTAEPPSPPPPDLRGTYMPTQQVPMY